MQSSRRYDSIDGLKGLLMLLILFHHIFPMLPAAAGGGRILDAIPLTSFITTFGGDLGDCLFFMLSGFLISTGYRQRISEHRVSFQTYLWKRLWKLYPMYILSNLAMLVVQILEYGPSAINLQRIVFTALLELGGALSAHPYNGPSWFLSTLFLCYAVYYLVAYYATRPTQYYCTLAAAIALGYAMFDISDGFSLFNSQLGMGLGNFFLGCAFCEIYPIVSRKQLRWLPIAALAVLGGSFYLMMRYGVEIIAGDSLTAFAFLISPLMIYLALDLKPFSWLLRTRPIAFLGKISLSVYLWHFPLFIIMEYCLNLFGLQVTERLLPLYLLLTFPLCYMAYRLDERRKAPAKTTPA